MWLLNVHKKPDSAPTKKRHTQCYVSDFVMNVVIILAPHLNFLTNFKPWASGYTNFYFYWLIVVRFAQNFNITMTTNQNRHDNSVYSCEWWWFFHVTCGNGKKPNESRFNAKSNGKKMTLKCFTLATHTRTIYKVPPKEPPASPISNIFHSFCSSYTCFWYIFCFYSNDFILTMSHNMVKYTKRWY